MKNTHTVHFTKCHGAGNDFIVIDETQRLSLPESLKPAFARLVGERQRGIGADGIIFVSSVDDTHPRMQFFNPDGTTAEMSGNGMRCASRVAYEGRYTNQSPLIFETPGGRFKTENFLSPEHGLAFVTVTIDVISMDPSQMLKSRETAPFVGAPVDAADATWEGTLISIGNPHLIISVADLKAINLMRVGDALEHHPMFSNRANVSFVQVMDPGTLLVQTHERGVGLTLSCGTGMTASVIAHVLNGSVHNHAPVEVHTAGGIVWITPMVEGPVMTARLTGNATFVYKGTSRFQSDGPAIRFASDTRVEKTRTYEEEHARYLQLVAKSQFDRSLLVGTPLAPLMAAFHV